METTTRERIVSFAVLEATKSEFGSCFFSALFEDIRSVRCEVFWYGTGEARGSITFLDEGGRTEGHIEFPLGASALVLVPPCGRLAERVGVRGAEPEHPDDVIRFQVEMGCDHIYFSAERNGESLDSVFTEENRGGHAV